MFWIVLVLATYAVTTLALTTGASPHPAPAKGRVPAFTQEGLSCALASPFGC
jgi:hypothetical protein